MSPPRVVLAILDAFPHDRVSPDLTPTLWSLASEGGRAPRGGEAVLTAATYPNHATFLTGAEPDVHRMFTNKVQQGGELVPAQNVGPAAETLFDRCRAADRRAVAAFGDQNLVGVCGAEKADAHWPPKGVLPDGTPKAPLGYATDRAVADALDRLDLASADLLVLQLDEVDTARHLHGSTTPDALEQCRATDRVFGEVLTLLEPEWAETVVIALSDHDQEDVSEGAIDLRAEAAAHGFDVLVAHEGTAAVVSGAIDDARLREMKGITGTQQISPLDWVVWGEPGQQFGLDWGLKAQHGSPRTRTQMAIVGGGHPATEQIAHRIEAAPPPATLWAGLIADLLELP